MTKIQKIKEALQRHIAESQNTASKPWKQSGVFYLVGKDRKTIADFSTSSRNALECCNNLKFCASARTMSPLVCEVLLKLIEAREAILNPSHGVRTTSSMIAENELNEISELFPDDI